MVEIQSECNEMTLWRPDGYDTVLFCNQSVLMNSLHRWQ